MEPELLPGKLGVVLLNWHQAEDTISAVRHIAGWNLPVAIWVVDNGSSTESIAQIRRACPAVNLVENGRNLGFGGGNNVGLRAALDAGCQFVLLQNNDAWIAAADMRRLLRACAAADVGAVGPVLWSDDQPPQLLSAGGGDIGVQLSTHLQNPPGIDDLLSVPYVPGTCILLHRPLLEKAGLLDETYFFSGEIADLCARARAAGFRCLIVGGARATHHMDRSAADRRHLHIYYVLRNRFLFVRKFHQTRKMRLFLFWSRQCALVWADAVRRGEWQRARAGRLALLDGWGGRFGNQNNRVTRGAIP
jgi:GT2 family glycosyltransferase